MKKAIQGLLAATVLMGANLSADTATNKTFHKNRPIGVNLTRELTGVHEKMHRDLKDGEIGGLIQVNGFYSSSNKSSSIGEYFGFDCRNRLLVGTTGTSQNANPNVMVDNRNLFHQKSGPINLEDTLDLRFKRKAGGVDLMYYQNFDRIFCRGLYMIVYAPVANVKHEASLGLDNPQKCTVNGSQIGLTDYFNGTYETDSNSENYQLALKCAKITPSMDVTRLADIDIIFGYDWFRVPDARFSFNVGFTIPTGNRPHADYLWEPIVGNGGHWALGVGMTGGATAWESNTSDCCQSIEFWTAANYRYLFERGEDRVVGLKGIANKWGWYMLAGASGERGVQPTANFLCQHVTVEPGSQIDAIFAASYRINCFLFDIGYNVYAHEKERVRLRCFDNDNTYALAGVNYDTNGVFLSTDIAAPNSNIREAALIGNNPNAAFITQCDLDTKVAESPAVVSNKLFAVGSYDWCVCSVPTLLKLGGYYEFSSSKKGLSNWSVFGGLTVTY